MNMNNQSHLSNQYINNNNQIGMSQSQNINVNANANLGYNSLPLKDA